MEITKINLVNFRNYDKLSIDLNSKMNIFIGNNAQGKTNILESIVVLALSKSHRLGHDLDIIKFGKSKAKIVGKVKNNRLIKELSVEIGTSEKKLYVNKTPIKKVAKYISNLNIISFTPDSLEIIKSSPSIRRNVLNIQLSQLSKLYLNTLNEYNKLLKTRNEYLKLLITNHIADKKYLDVITEKLIEKAVVIYIKRYEYISLVNKNIDIIHKKITDVSGIEIKYIPNIEFLEFSQEELRDKLRNTFKKNYFKELNYGMTLFGPHRDDFTFLINGEDLKLYGSQGQQRMAVICYKLSEIEIFENNCNTKPVLLFDDVFSELDIKKRNGLLEFIGDDIQSIVTTTDLKNIRRKYLEDAYVFKVEKGNVTRK